jgi:hypothetical protein
MTRCGSDPWAVPVELPWEVPACAACGVENDLLDLAILVPMGADKLIKVCNRITKDKTNYPWWGIKVF